MFSIDYRRRLRWSAQTFLLAASGLVLLMALTYRLVADPTTSTGAAPTSGTIEVAGPTETPDVERVEADDGANYGELHIRSQAIPSDRSTGPSAGIVLAGDDVASNNSEDRAEPTGPRSTTVPTDQPSSVRPSTEQRSGSPSSPASDTTSTSPSSSVSRTSSTQRQPSEDLATSSANPTTSASASASASVTQPETSTSVTQTTPPSTTQPPVDTAGGPRINSDAVSGESGKDLKIKVLDNDDSEPEDLEKDTLVIVSGPDHAESFRVHGDHLHYRSVDDFTGVDRLRYQVCDDVGRCGQATVTITLD